MRCRVALLGLSRMRARQSQQGHKPAFRVPSFRVFPCRENPVTRAAK